MVCIYLSQNKLLAVERDRSAKDLEMLKENIVSTKAKNSELETENQELEQALRELREQSTLCSVLIMCLLIKIS